MAFSLPFSFLYAILGLECGVLFFQFGVFFMYKLLAVEPFVMTRFLSLENTITGTIDRCFDDSDVVSDQNFSFMEFNALYDCKIKLFGNPVKHIKHNPNAVFLKILNQSCYIERKEFIKVAL